jgi:hypothetical protein
MKPIPAIPALEVLQPIRAPGAAIPPLPLPGLAEAVEPIRAVASAVSRIGYSGASDRLGISQGVLDAVAPIRALAGAVNGPGVMLAQLQRGPRLATMLELPLLASLAAIARAANPLPSSPLLSAFAAMHRPYAAEGPNVSMAWLTAGGISRDGSDEANDG